MGIITGLIIIGAISTVTAGGIGISMHFNGKKTRQAQLEFDEAMARADEELRKTREMLMRCRRQEDEVTEEIDDLRKELMELLRTHDNSDKAIIK